MQLQQDETERQSYADTDTRKMSGLEKDAKQAVHHFKIIDYGLANFEETYACGPDLTHDEVAPAPQPVHVQFIRLLHPAFCICVGATPACGCWA